MNAGEKTLRENGLKMQENLQAQASTSTNVPLSEHRKSSDNAAHSSNRCLTPGTEEASRDTNSRPSDCEPADVDGGGGGEVCNQTQREEMVDTQEHPTLLHTTPSSHSSYESICIDTRAKKRKKRKKIAQIHASMEDQRREEPADVCLLESVGVKPQIPQSTDEAESNERSLHDERTGRQEERTSRDHRKRKKRKTKTANILWEEDLESDVTITDSMFSLEGGVKKDDGDVRQSEQSSTTDGALNDAEGMKFKRKKNEKEKKNITADEREESVKGSEKDLALGTGVEWSYPKSTREVTNALEDSVPNTKRSAEDQSPKAVKKKKQKHEVKMDSSDDRQSDFSVALQKRGGPHPSYVLMQGKKMSRQPGNTSLSPLKMLAHNQQKAQKILSNLTVVSRKRKERGSMIERKKEKGTVKGMERVSGLPQK